MRGPLTIIICIWSIQVGHCQDLKNELHSFLKSEILQGNYAFQLMKNKLRESEKRAKLVVDENGKILNPGNDFTPVGDETTIEFMPSGTIKLALKYHDSLLTIQPLGNSFCPTIKIDMNATTAHINDQALRNLKKVTIRNKKNVFNSEWTGFQWNTDPSDESRLIKPRLTLGRIKEDGKIYMEILWFEKGKKMHYRLLN